MHAIPTEKGARHQTDKPLNRAELILAQGGEPALPDVGEVSYLLGYWQDLGLVGSGAMGATRLTAQELLAWQEGCGIRLDPWEFRVLREMSSHYISSLHESTLPESPAPLSAFLDTPLNETNRDLIQKKVVSQFKAFMLAQSSQHPAKG